MSVELAASYSRLLEVRDKEIAELKGTLHRIHEAISSDAYAITFQTMGKYRSALLKMIPPPQGK